MLAKQGIQPTSANPAGLASAAAAPPAADAALPWSPPPRSTPSAPPAPVPASMAVLAHAYLRLENTADKCYIAIEQHACNTLASTDSNVLT